jgi:hypothetical protein
MFGEASIAVDEVQCEDLGLERRQFRKLRFEIHGDQLPGAFHLERLAHCDVQVGDVVVGVEHPGQDEIDFLFSHDASSLRALRTEGRDFGCPNQLVCYGCQQLLRSADRLRRR